MSGCAGLWDCGGLLWLVRLSGDLSGVLLYLLPNVGQPIRAELTDSTCVGCTMDRRDSSCTLNRSETPVTCSKDDGKESK